MTTHQRILPNGSPIGKLDTIEQGVAELLRLAQNQPAAKPAVRTYPRKLTENMKTVLALALESLEAPFTMDDLITTANNIDPETVLFSKGGQISYSIKTWMAERLGLKAKWAQETFNDKPRSRRQEGEAV